MITGILHPVSKGIQLANNTLLIESVTSEDEGWYVCTAGNKGGKSQGRVYLLVKDPLKIYVEPANITYEVGDSARFTCYASGKPQPQLEWRRDLRTITVSIQWPCKKRKGGKQALNIGQLCAFSPYKAPTELKISSRGFITFSHWHMAPKRLKLA